MDGCSRCQRNRTPSRVRLSGGRVGWDESVFSTGILNGGLPWSAAHEMRGSRPAPYCSDAEAIAIWGSLSKASKPNPVWSPSAFHTTRQSSLWLRMASVPHAVTGAYQ